MQAREGGEARGPVRDALTLFDESGVIVASIDAGLSELLTGFQWKPLFWERRGEVVGGMRFHLFGHALYEKALRPYKGITGKCVILDMSERELDLPLPQQLAALDGRLARMLAELHSLDTPEAYAPLPVLGVPGWSPDNEYERYYDDSQQFRPGRRQAEAAAETPSGRNEGGTSTRKGRRK